MIGVGGKVVMACGTAQDGNSDGTSRAGGVEIMGRVADKGDFVRFIPEAGDEGGDHAGMGLAAMAGIVTDNVIEMRHEAEDFSLLEGGGLAIIGRDPDFVASGDQGCDDFKRIADGNEAVLCLCHE